MKNTPSALKWLAEKRGRLAFDLAQTRQIAADVNARVASLEVDLAAVDRAITIFDANIDPEDLKNPPYTVAELLFALKAGGAKELVTGLSTRWAIIPTKHDHPGKGREPTKG